MSQVNYTSSATNHQDSHSSNVTSTPIVSELPAAKYPTPTSTGTSNATSTSQKAPPSQNPKQKAADTSSGKLLLREWLVKMIPACLNFSQCWDTRITNELGYSVVLFWWHSYSYRLCYGHWFSEKLQCLDISAGITRPPTTTSTSQRKHTLEYVVHSTARFPTIIISHFEILVI